MIFENAAQFSLYIEEYASNNRLSHLDAVLKYCSDNFLEPDEIKGLINFTLKSKIAVDLQEQGLMVKSASLDEFC